MLALIIDRFCDSNILKLVMLFQGAGQDRLGIYIKSVVVGGAADAVSY